jgi:hypothetical protein
MPSELLALSMMEKWLALRSVANEGEYQFNQRGRFGLVPEQGCDKVVTAGASKSLGGDGAPGVMVS